MKLNLSSGASIILEIRDQELRLLSFNNGLLQKAARRPIPAETIRNGQILDVKGLGKEIKNFIDYVRDETGNINSLNIVLSGLRTTCRTIEVPEMDNKLQKKYVERQIEKEMPLSVKELLISTFPVKQNDNQSYVRQILVVGIPRSLVDKLKEALYLAGVKKASFTIRPFALTGQAAKGDAIIFDIETDEFNIIITHDSQPQMVYSRSLDSSSATIDASQHGGTLTEIQRSYEYLRDFILGHKDFEKLACYLTGTASRDEKIKTGIKHTYGLRLELPQYESNLPAEAKSGAYDSSLGLSSLLSKNGGFFSKTPNFPGYIAPQEIHGPPSVAEKVVWRSLSYLPYLLGASLLAFVFYNYQTQQDILQQKKEIVQRFQSQENAQRMVLLKSKKIEADIKKMQASLEEVANEYRTIDRKSMDYKENIQYVSDTASGLTITNINARDNKLTLEGRAREMQIALDYATTLAKSTGLSNVRTSNITAVASGTVTAADYIFTVTAEISKSNAVLADNNLSVGLRDMLNSSSAVKP